jgi:hypothetical protein
MSEDDSGSSWLIYIVGGGLVLVLILGGLAVVFLGVRVSYTAPPMTVTAPSSVHSGTAPVVDPHTAPADRTEHAAVGARFADDQAQDAAIGQVAGKPLSVAAIALGLPEDTFSLPDAEPGAIIEWRIEVFEPAEGTITLRACGNEVIGASFALASEP